MRLFCIGIFKSYQKSGSTHRLVPDFSVFFDYRSQGSSFKFPHNKHLVSKVTTMEKLVKNDSCEILIIDASITGFLTAYQSQSEGHMLWSLKKTKSMKMASSTHFI